MSFIRYLILGQNLPNFLNGLKWTMEKPFISRPIKKPSNAFSLLDFFLIITNVYCKTDAFPFHVISLPFLESNLDDKICYKVFYGQVIRYQRLCNFLSGFEERTKYLLDILKERGYDVDRLGREFCKAVECYISEFQKWVIPLDFNKWFIDINQGVFFNVMFI